MTTATAPVKTLPPTAASTATPTAVPSTNPGAEHATPAPPSTTQPTVPTLPLARYRFTFRLEQPLALPDYAGSLLRGQLGAELRRAACLTRAPVCDGCPLRTGCAYAQVFEAPAPEGHTLQAFSHIPNPYVVEPPPPGTRTYDAGERLQCTLVLFGNALRHLPLLFQAMRNMLEQRGLGRTRSKGRLERIEHHAPDSGLCPPIWQPGDTTLARHDTRFLLAPPAAPNGAGPTPERITLHFTTPLRLQHQGRPVRCDALTPRKLAADLLRRITLMAEFHAGNPALNINVPALVAHADTLQHRKQLQWHDWTRYSSRQQQAMTLGGAMGQWQLQGDLAPLLPWLRLGQWLHVGKNATMGLGRYHLATPDHPPEPA